MLTAKNKRALDEGLAMAIAEMLDERIDELVTEAQWQTPDGRDEPKEYWTTEVERYLRRQIIRISASVQKGGRA